MVPNKKVVYELMFLSKNHMYLKMVNHTRIFIFPQFRELYWSSRGSHQINSGHCTVWAEWQWPHVLVGSHWEQWAENTVSQYLCLLLEWTVWAYKDPTLWIVMQLYVPVVSQCLCYNYLLLALLSEQNYIVCIYMYMYVCNFVPRFCLLAV